MRYKLLGKTGMNVSEMALGTWGIGGAGWDDNPEETRLDAIRAAVECGINMIDTAPAYNGGVAERYIGKVLKDMGVRKDMMITTKCGTEFINGTYVRSCARDTILRECEESLRNLQTDYIDLYLIHWPDAKVPMEETMDALNTLKQQGKVLHVGVSNFTKEQTEEANRYCPVEVYQPQYSMVFRTNEPQIKWAAEQGIVTGMGDGIFAPDGNITREQLATMLYRYDGGTAAGADLSRFSDAGSISSWAAEAMDWAVAGGVLSGDDTGRLAPGGAATRAEVAQMLYNYSQR